MKKTLAAFLILFSLPAFAGSYYLKQGAIPPTSIPAPYTEKTEPHLADLSEIKKTQLGATPELRLRAIAEQNMSPAMIASALYLTRYENPYLYNFLGRVEDDCRTVIDEAKTYWKMRRPYAVDNKIELLVRGLGNHSYPSGHTACGLVWAEVLGQIFPGKIDILRAKAKESARFRMIVGVHYPNDIRAGETMGKLIFEALQKSNAYRTDLETIRKQYR